MAESETYKALTALWFVFAVAICSFLPSAASAEERGVTPGAFIIERPTLLSLGFEWKISGDDNRNAKVTVRYRKVGDKQWRQS